MKVRIERVSISQCAKVIAGIYFVISLPIVVFFALTAMAGRKVAIGIAALVVVPLAYALLSYLGGLLCAWIYNLVDGRIGGFEYTTAEITTSP